MRSRGEVEAQRELEAEGYLVDYKARPHRVGGGYQVDLLGAFDLVAYRPGELRFVSVKAESHGLRREHREAVGRFRFPGHCSKEVWLCDERGRVRRKEKL